MSRAWIWEKEGWSEFKEFAGDMGEAMLGPAQAYVPGVDAVIDTVEYAQNPNPENAVDIFVPEEFEPAVDVAGSYGPGGENNDTIFPDDGVPNLNEGYDPTPSPNDPVNTPIPMDDDLDEEPPEEPPEEDDPSWVVPEEPDEGPPTTVFDDAWDDENEEEEIDFTTPPQEPGVSNTSQCCCCCCPCQCS